LAFSSTIKGMTAGVGGIKRIFGTFDGASVTTGTITWKGTTQVYNPIGAGAVQSTTVTTAGSSVDGQLTAGTYVLTFESGAAGYWWVDVQ
jgi:hypothetical protein